MDFNLKGKRKPFFGACIMTAAVALSACSGTGGGDNPDVKARQDMMQNWGDASDVMKDMVENPDTFDLAVFQEQASFLAGDAPNAWAHFEDSSAVGGATQAVWSDPEDFAAKAANFEQVTANLNTAAQSATGVADVEAAYGEVGPACGSCHKVYKAD